MSKRKQKDLPESGGAPAETQLSGATNMNPEPTSTPLPENDEPNPLEGKDFHYHQRSQLLKEIARSAAEREETTAGDIGTDEAGNEVFIPADAGEAGAKPAAAGESADGEEQGTEGDGEEGAQAPAGGDAQQGSAAPAPVDEHADPNKFRRVVINGQEQFVPIDKVIERGIAAYQKETAADVNLGLAAQILEQAKALQQPQHREAPPKSQEQNAMDNLIVETAKRIQYGTPEDAQQALVDFRNIIAQDVATTVASQARTHTIAVIDQRDAAKQFGEKYPDVVSDPNLLELAFSMEDRMRRMGDQRPWGTVYNEIGKELRERYVPKEKWPATAGGGAAPAQGAPQGGSMAPSQARVQRKENATAAVAGTGGGAPPKAEPKPLTTAQAIAKMAKARGQQID